MSYNKFSENILQNIQGLSAGSFNSSGMSGGVNVNTPASFHIGMAEDFDIATINATYRGYLGGIFDGRYIYMCPGYNTDYHGLFTRYDTTASFTTAGSYATYDLATNVNSKCKGYVCGCFDGRYIYIIPNYNATDKYHGVIIRYDTTASFTTAGSYTIYDIAANVDSRCKGFNGVCFDGRYIYIVPYTNDGIAYSGVIVKYDTTASFTTPGSYSFFDLATINASYVGYAGAIFDGTHIYLAPYTTAASTFSGTIIRYDTRLSFTSAASYSAFDLTTINIGAKGYYNLAFDGSNIYITPWSNTVRHGLFVKYNINSDFTSVTSYKIYDITNVNAGAKGYIGAIFDGNYVYLIPYHNGTAVFGLTIRYNINKDVNISTSYETLDLASLNAGDIGFLSACHDGQYLYFIPYSNSSGASGRIVRIRTSLYNRFKRK
jgi:hypothetical protein